MIKPYITPDEIKLRHPGISNLIPEGESAWSLIGAAARDVISDLGDRGDKATIFQVPLMWDSLELYQTTSFSSTTQSTLLDGKNSGRFVVDCTTAPSDTVTVTLEGTYDSSSDSDTKWFDVMGIDGSPVSIEVNDATEYSTPIMPAVSYRYTVTVGSGDSMTARVYLVSERVQDLIRYKFLVLLMEGMQDGDDRIANLYDEYKLSYSQRLQSMRDDVDADEDGEIDEEEELTQQANSLLR